MNDINTYTGSVIYKATNLVNRKCYVGKSINFRNRYQKHKSAKYYNTAFHNAIRKYGFDQFKFEILEYCEPKDLIIRENYWILYNDSINPEKGYNLRLDSKDNSGWKHSDKSKALISESGKGRKPWHAGRKVGNLKSKEGIDRFVKQMSGAGNPNAKRVYQYDNSGTYIQTFECVSTAARQLNISFKGISRCALGERKSYKGFKWSYNKPYLVVTLNTNFFNCWKLLADDAEDNQQRSLIFQERSTTMAEMPVDASASKREAPEKGDDIVYSCKKLQAGFCPGAELTTQCEYKVWELAGVALTSFITGIDNYRNDLLVITEFHADFDEKLNSFQLYTPAGKMITEKFKPESYYDVLLCTKAVVTEEANGDFKREYFFVTEKTSDFPLARGMNIFDTTLIPNDLGMVIKKVRENMGIPDVVYP